jgi:carbon-monoxide dehydrogenase medium subunit
MDFVDARELSEALAALGERGDDATVLAGGTDVMVQYLAGQLAPSTLLHIRRLDALRGISCNGATRLGALTTHWQLMTSPEIAREHAALCEAAATVGGRQTQNAGTIGGNIVNASPAADLLPPLLVANASLTLQSSSGTRTMALDDFLLGRKQTARNADELLTAIALEPPAPRTGETYLKIGRRRAMEVAIVGLAARLTFAEDGTVTDARLAVCSVAPTAYRASEAEASLRGTRLEKDAVTSAAQLLASSASPIDDPRATATYRRRVLAPLLERAVAICKTRAGV